MSGFATAPRPAAAGRRGDRRAVVVPRLRAALRPGPAAVLRHAAAAHDPARRRDQDRGLPRSSGSTAAGGATSRCTTCGVPRAASSSRRSLAYVTVYLVSPVHNVRLPRSIAVMDLLITLALVAGVRLLARTLIERPRSGDLVARGKEVHRRRRRRRRPARSCRRCSARGCSATRRSASSTTTAASGTRASRASACSARRRSCRASSASTSRTRC